MLIETSSNNKGEVSFSKYGVDRKGVCVCRNPGFTADCRWCCCMGDAPLGVRLNNRWDMS